jgi:hypothetical protein
MFPVPKAPRFGGDGPEYSVLRARSEALRVEHQAAKAASSAAGDVHTAVGGTFLGSAGESAVETTGQVEAQRQQLIPTNVAGKLYH